MKKNYRRKKCCSEDLYLQKQNLRKGTNVIMHLNEGVIITPF